MTVSPPHDEQMRPERVITRLVDRVFGYDFFLSYSRSDGMHLPQRLKERLEHAGFRVFLDQTEYVAGADLRRETRRQVLKSRKIVVIGRPGAFRSEWVRREVAVALASDVGPVILDLNGALAAAPADAPLAAMVRERDWLRLPETLPNADGEPSDHIVAELVRSFNHTRQETRRQRVFLTAALVLFVMAAVASWQAWQAIQARDIAEAEQRRAERALDQVQSTANRSVQALALRIRTTRETSAATPQIQPCTLANLPAYDALAATALKVGEGEAALKLLGNCLSMAEANITTAADGAAWQTGAAMLHQRIGELSDAADKERHFRASLTLWRGLADRSAPAREPLAAALNRLGDVQLTSRRADTALPLYREALSHLEALADSQPARGERRQLVSATYQRIADALLQLGNPGEALGWADKDLQTYGDLAGIEQTAPDRQRDVASSLDRRAQALDLLGRMGESDRAIDQFWQALQLRERLATSQEDPGWLSELTEAYRRSSELMLHIDRVAEAREMAEQYLLAASINADATRDKLSRMRRALGTVCWTAVNDGQFGRALWVGQRAVELSPQRDWVSLNYAHALMLSGQPDAARTIYRELDAAPGDAGGLRRQMRDDFAVLRRRGHGHPLMAEIEATMRSVNAAPNQLQQP